jgi:16S rRNA (cytosine1402-N4)-methyltransferase
MESGEQREVHVPVLVDEVLEALAAALDASTPRAMWVVDATLGAAGHARSVLEAFPHARVLGLDQDPQILEIARARLASFGARARVLRARLSEARAVIERELDAAPRALLMDLGVSSLQFDRAERGFSVHQDGPLDMRMDPTRERTAADIVNHWDEDDLADLIYFEGGEPRSRAIARAIAQSRARAPFRRTAPLAELISRVLGGQHGRIHPATRTFQALRRAVNEESEELDAGLQAGEACLADGGALLAISFHSGEDAEVKRFLSEGTRAGRWRQLGARKGSAPQRSERRANPRSRSARLRAAQRVRSSEDPCALPDEVRP